MVWKNVEISLDIDAWKASIHMACRWMIDRSMIKTKGVGFRDTDFCAPGEFTDWRGAFRGEYTAATGEWDIFGPAWHAAQGVKALSLAYAVLGEPEYLEAAQHAADFILRHQITAEDDPDHGLILTYEGRKEDSPPLISSSGTLETVDGLFTLSEVSGDPLYSGAALAALRWLKAKMFLPTEGLFIDGYNLGDRTVNQRTGTPRDVNAISCRPLLDDGVFVKAFELTGDPSFKQVAVTSADRLLKDENPAGNWVKYGPANAVLGIIHPRHAYWWGRPMWMVHNATGDQRYLNCCRRSAQWYVNASRADGGLFRHTDLGFNTTSFNHATSGTACAAILWHDLAHEFGDTNWHEPLKKALIFCRSVQFTRAEDPNLQGAILEKTLPPRGSDAPPWQLRDIGTFFFVQAACLALRDMPEVLEWDEEFAKANAWWFRLR